MNIWRALHAAAKDDIFAKKVRNRGGFITLPAWLVADIIESQAWDDTKVSDDLIRVIVEQAELECYAKEIPE